MSRIGYAPGDHPEDDELSALVRADRGWVPNVFRVLQWSPDVAEGWARLANALRRTTNLDARTRQLTILLVAHLKDSAYEWSHHSRVAAAAGVAAHEVDWLAAWPERAGWTPADWAVLTWVDASVQGNDVPPWCRDNLLTERGAPFLVDLTATAAYYMAVAQFTRTLEIEPD